MSAKDKTEEVLKSIHVLFSKAEPIEGSKKKVIVDRDRMMGLLKDLNDCMYEMMDEYELTKRAKERAMRDIKKQHDEMAMDARKNAEDIYAASLMYSDHAIDEISSIIDKASKAVDKAYSEMENEIEKKKTVLRDNQLDLKNQLSNLIDSQKYLMLIENENIRLKHEESLEGEGEWGETKKEYQAPDIKINEEYFKAAGLMDEDSSFENNESSEKGETSKLLDDEYFEWKDGEDKEKAKPKRGFFRLGGKSE